MPGDHLEAIRGVYARWAEGDFTAGPELYDRNVLMVQAEDLPDPGAYLGSEGIARYMRGFLEAWEDVTISATALRSEGDTVVADVVQQGAGKGSGARTELRYHHLWTFRGDRVVRFETVKDRSGLAALGLAAS